MLSVGRYLFVIYRHVVQKLFRPQRYNIILINANIFVKMYKNIHKTLFIRYPSKVS